MHAAPETSPALPAVDLGAVLRDLDAMDALRWAVSRLRALQPRSGDDALAHLAALAPGDRALFQFSVGYSVDAAALASVTGRTRLDALVGAGAAVLDGGGGVTAGVALLFLRGLAVAYPYAQSEDRDKVYVGLEAPWLMKLAVRHGPGAGTAADLATGTGVVAAALAPLYSCVVATDVTARAAACAELTLRLNEIPTSCTRALVADVAAGLREDSFDLVVANPPWVPSRGESGEEPGFLAAGGGSTGMELPARFVDAATRLLRPGGTAIVLVCDTLWDDGARPLDDQLAMLRELGFAAQVEPPHATVWTDADTAELVRGTPGLVEGRVVALVFRRPAA